MNRFQCLLLLCLIINLFASERAFRFYPNRIESTECEGEANFAIDFDSDGDIDIISSDIYHLVLLQNDGEQNFKNIIIDGTPKSNSRAGALGNQYAADFDSDGDLDIVYLNFIYLNDGSNSTFVRDTVTKEYSNYPTPFVVDFDNDNDLDLLYNIYSLDDVYWYENDGNANFTQRVIGRLDLYQTSNISVDVADYDLDSDNDILVGIDGVAKDSIYVILYVNQGDNQTYTKKVLSKYKSATEVVFYDFNNDDTLECVVGFEDNIVWFKKNSDDSLVEEEIISTNESRCIFFRDMDKNGEDELIVAAGYNSAGRISIYTNTGNNVFDPSKRYSFSSWCDYPDIVDLNQDGKLDIVASVSKDVYWNLKTGWYDNWITTEIVEPGNVVKKIISTETTKIIWEYCLYPKVDIEYSLNGIDWQTIENGVDNNASYDWIVPITHSNTRIRLLNSDTKEELKQSGWFNIVYGEINIDTITDIAEKDTADITWSSMGHIGKVRIEYRKYQDSSWTFVDTVADIGIYKWFVPEGLYNTYYLKLTSTVHPDEVSSKELQIHIQPSPKITITSPNGGEEWHTKSSGRQYIKWDKRGLNLDDTLNIEYSIDNGKNWIYIDSIPAVSNSASYLWFIPQITSSDSCLIRVVYREDSSISDISDSLFSIVVDPELEIITPQTDDILDAGQQFDITWDFWGGIENVHLLYTSKHYNGPYDTIISNLQNNGSYTWTVPNILSDSCIVKITSTLSQTVRDNTGYFSIDDYVKISDISKNVKIGNKLIVIPNPINSGKSDQLEVYYKTDEKLIHGSIKIYDVVGNCIFEETIENLHYINNLNSYLLFKQDNPEFLQRGSSSYLLVVYLTKNNGEMIKVGKYVGLRK